MEVEILPMRPEVPCAFWLYFPIFCQELAAHNTTGNGRRGCYVEKADQLKPSAMKFVKDIGQGMHRLCISVLFGEITEIMILNYLPS